MSAAASPSALRIALVGNPNCGKTALFNRLTGSRQKVANYAGVTVERKEGYFVSPAGRQVRILDLPGAYSLHAASLDEAITRDVCLGQRAGEARPDLLVSVVDATNLRLHLRFVLELRQLGLPMVVVLNMSDAAARRGIQIDRDKLSAALGVPVVSTVAVRRDGAAALVSLLDATLPPAPPAGAASGPDFDVHAEVNRLLSAAVSMPARTAALDDRLDRIVLHPVFGLLLLAVLLFLMFQAVFSWAEPLMDGIEGGVHWAGEMLGAWLPDGMLKSLLVDGLVAGLGSVVVFLPQILILFLFILTLEESGYLPRAAFLLDRLMMGAGLSGRSFIPLLSSFACAIPGIMATRTIQDPRDRLTTILVAPLMTCSARLPVYALLIGAFIPERTVMGLFNLQGLVLFALYVAGIVSALVVAYALKFLRRDRTDHPLLMELPSYRIPNPRDIAIGLWERARIFLSRVGKVILALTVLLWFLSTFPSAPAGATAPAIDYSFAGMIGHALQKVFAPVGFNWQICIALVPGLAAREVAVGALATVYALSGSEETVATQLAPMIAAQWSLATALSLLAWYVFAPQCISTLAVIRRETDSWKVMALSAAYLTGLAYLAAFVTYRVALMFS
ncbi:ferrous iron transport protein B [Cupriavidus taiwanensis]|uniref:Ferrous iron transport protein B n=1 Tax=Cupriavidus taiwanensis TaxID=164546 RepID=A0A375IQ80_9BURK|nr:ferrous iron transport protein B [Cupriavidus taiwanensis]SOY69186.1 Ferrous iron transport protein B [Cupriavidus taiwanensis]SOY69859.1 Ferrous iron transport protein B [Cupriavidus taiwanensis]SOY92270.1 Ferrous iron transport protein B [Cupriavidus taiwanensis]SOZ29425.1 Ferrous iron transport protein B [Cupriavidus taiwanensis]SOZ74036.1 Ferrous iron transport protein B [Cupriavidus taiwanensis]